MPPIALVAAVADNGVIGVGTGLPWRLSSDMKRFRALTIGKPVIMGRKTYETIGKPLAGRRNIVVTRRKDFAAEGIVVASSLDAALTLAAEGAPDEIMVIGGGEIYAETIGRADRLYITHVEAKPEGDTRFPPIDPAIWRAGPEERLPAGEKDSAATRFIVYDRLRSRGLS
jgi:dihydrofolate reductase